MKLVRVLSLVVFCAFVLNAYSNPPPELDYQGKVLVNDVPYNGNGYFKFAICNLAGTTNYWSNDGTGAGQPTGCLTNSVFNGVFSTVLGAAPMTLINPDIFNNGNDLYLRVWFGTTSALFNEMLPAQKIESSAYAINADQVDGMDASEIVSAATNGVSLSGDVSGSPAAGTTVNSLQGDALNVGTPAAGEGLVWNGTAWSNAPGGMSSAAASNAFVIKTGDTMTGILGIDVGVGSKLIITNTGSDIQVGRNALADVDSVSIGGNTAATNGGVAVGYNARGLNAGAAVGRGANANQMGSAVGFGANASDFGVAVGDTANGRSAGTALGRMANGLSSGAAVGSSAQATNYGAALGFTANGASVGAAVGQSANGRMYGAALGALARGEEYGAAVGYSAYGQTNGAAVGQQANGNWYGAALGYLANSHVYGVALGFSANGWSNGVAVGNAAVGHGYGTAVGRQANGTQGGIAVGDSANGNWYGAAVGFGAVATNAGVAVGWQAAANREGVAVGYSADADVQGAAVGREANGIDSGAALGYQADGYYRGVAVGQNSRGGFTGVAVGQGSSGFSNGVAVGASANGVKSVAVGYGASGYNQGVAVGENAYAGGQGVAVGLNAVGTNWGTAVGAQASGPNLGTAVGNTANGDDYGVALGVSASAAHTGTAVGALSYGYEHGAAVGSYSLGQTNGAAVGKQSDGTVFGAAVGSAAKGSSYGVAVGHQANGINGGVAAGYQSYGYDGGVAIGSPSWAIFKGVAIGAQADGNSTNIAIGLAANAGLTGARERISVGHDVTNTFDNSARIRGTLYMDGGTALVARSTFGTGPWTTLVPLPPLDNVVWVATNGTSFGPGTVDRPFDSPQAGYNAAALLYSNEPAAIVICAGRYGLLNMNAKNVHVFGLDRPQLGYMTVNSTPAPFIMGKIRVENVVFTDYVLVNTDMGGVKFNNCRFQGGLNIYGGKTEVMNCFATAGDGSAIIVGSGAAAQDIAIYNSAAEITHATLPAVDVATSVSSFEMKGCQIVNLGGGPALRDQEPGPINPLHLYTHNYIKGPSAAAGGPGGMPAVVNPPAATNAMAFHQNTVWGHVGLLGSTQVHANNSIYGLMNWLQGGAGAGMDIYGNVQYNITPQALPDSWND